MGVIILSIGGKISQGGLICATWVAVSSCFNWNIHLHVWSLF